ncbi:phage tail tape measure protein [Achromobacter xylosoxidans]|uniref:phage tail tape measure protein n=1 Tax=Alcaligenes xylosoxydans xylosoxydans TaxID=85698 RepID=UPI0006BEF15D|nr:phage tail tape measure protein [Achromobacter xylosoxidans]CUK06467.1 Phage-related minor tail protein [Achromobacter xylosoxidans]
MSEFVVGVRVDGTAAGLAKAALEAKKALDNMAVAGAKDLTAIGRATKQTETSLVNMATRTQREFARMAQARETLGIRSEHRIQQEILRTQAAYQRLASSGTMTWREQQRAAEQMRQTVGRLNAEMGVYSGKQRLVAGAQKAGLMAAGVMAGAAVVAPKVNRAFSYGDQLANMANTAYGDASLSAAEDRKRRFEGMKAMDLAIRAAVDANSSTQQEAAGALSEVLSSGRFGTDDSLAIFKEAVLAGKANQTAATDFVKIAFSAKETMGIAPKDMARLFGIATYAGQSGPFEVSDMARALPKQFGLARSVGITGLEGAAKVAALNQATRLVAGTSDQAATLSENLLAKMGSEDARNNFAKLGIPYNKKIAEGRMQGLDALDVTANLIEGLLGKNKNYQKALTAYQAAPEGSARKAALDDVMNIAKGEVISKIFPDREAGSGMAAYVLDRANANKIAKESMLYGTESIERNMWTVKASPSFQANRLKQASEFANYDAMVEMGPAVSTVAAAFADLAKSSPQLAAAISGSITILQGLAVGAGVVGLGGAALGVGKVASSVGAARAARAAATAAAAAAPSGATSALGGAGAGAAGGISAAGALSAGFLVAAPIAGALVQDNMFRTEEGLRNRIAQREEKIKMFDEMIALKQEVGDTPLSISKMQAERDDVVASRDDMNRRLQELLANTKIGGEVNVNITAAPGIQANADLQPNDGTRMTGNVGRTNVNTD